MNNLINFLMTLCSEYGVSKYRSTVTIFINNSTNYFAIMPQPASVASSCIISHEVVISWTMTLWPFKNPIYWLLVLFPGKPYMKGIPRVTTLEEPNFEGNIWQLGGKYWYFPCINCGKQLIIDHKTSSMHSKHPCTQYSKETSLFQLDEKRSHIKSYVPNCVVNLWCYPILKQCCMQ